MFSIHHNRSFATVGQSGLDVFNIHDLYFRGCKYYFAVRAVDCHKRVGYFSEPHSILLSNSDQWGHDYVDMSMSMFMSMSEHHSILLRTGLCSSLILIITFCKIIIIIKWSLQWEVQLFCNSNDISEYRTTDFTSKLWVFSIESLQCCSTAGCVRSPGTISSVSCLRCVGTLRNVHSSPSTASSQRWSQTSRSRGLCLTTSGKTLSWKKY